MILIQGVHENTESSCPVTLDFSASDGAEAALRRVANSEPNCLLAIFQKRTNKGSSNLRVLPQLVFLPTGKSLEGTNPESAVVRNQQVSDVVAGQLLTARRLPRNGANAVKAKQTKFRTQPEITVGSLGNRIYLASGKALANPPRGVGVLIDVEIGV